MKCDEYLQMLSTLPVEELTDGRAGDHLGSCGTIGRWVMGGLVVILLVFGGGMVSRFVFPPLREIEGIVVNETFRPRCLALTVAADLIRQEAPSRSLRISMRQGSSLLKVSGTPQDVIRARSVLDRYDDPTSSTCVLPQPGTAKR